MKKVTLQKFITASIFIIFLFAVTAFSKPDVYAEEATTVAQTTEAATVSGELATTAFLENEVSLSLSKSRYTLYPGQRVIPKINFIEEYTGKISYSSNNKSVAVFKNGVITAKSKGKATLFVNAGKNKLKIKVTVKKGIQNIDIVQNNISLNKKDKRYITVNIKQNNSDEPVIWSSSNPKIVKVNKNGRITGKKNGTAYIKCASKYSAKSDKIKVTVKNTKYIAFTFDDGPGPYTEDLLNTLSKYDAKATFFIVGNRIHNYSDALKKASAMGNEIGNHSYDHANLSLLSYAAVKDEFDKTNRLAKKYTGKNPTLIRPPYGAYNENVKSAADVPLILWSVDTLDWKNRNSEYVKNVILSNAANGEIVLLHDIHPTSVAGFKLAIGTLKEQGYELVTVSELYQLKGVKMKPKKAYFSCK